MVEEVGFDEEDEALIENMAAVSQMESKSADQGSDGQQLRCPKTPMGQSYHSQTDGLFEEQRHREGQDQSL